MIKALGLGLLAQQNPRNPESFAPRCVAQHRPAGLYCQVLRADIIFRNADGVALAEGKIREPYGILSISHPEVGDCSRYERQASGNAEARHEWQRCFEEMSRWLAAWVKKVRSRR
ncbi:MAG TPA: hypothetical protein VFS12_03335 [Terriglobia bacterium]|nr:hypothetical protein [Terriglobia bacterium]